MKIYSVYDPEFRRYGKTLEAYDTDKLLAAMEKIALPEQGTAYEPSIPAFHRLAVYKALRDRAFGGMPIQLGLCWGRNTKLNCLEYHRDCEVNIGLNDFILLLAKAEEIENGQLDTALVKAFRVPAGTPVELSSTTLHYAPCHTDAEAGFRVAVALSKGTGAEKPAGGPVNAEDARLWARNKWLFAHPDSEEARQGAFLGLRGENIDIAADIGGEAPAEEKEEPV